MSTSSTLETLASCPHAGTADGVVSMRSAPTVGIEAAAKPSNIPETNAAVAACVGIPPTTTIPSRPEPAGPRCSSTRSGETASAIGVTPGDTHSCASSWPIAPGVWNPGLLASARLTGAIAIGTLRTR